MFDLKQFRKDHSLTQINVAELFSCQQNFISNIENGIKAIPQDKLDILKDKFGDISKYIIDTSRPSVLPDKKTEKIATLRGLVSDIQQTGKNRDKVHFLPLMNIDAVGGSENDIYDTSEYVEELIPVYGAQETSILISVSGDSMMPIFSPGDLVVIDEVVEWGLFLEMGQYYVIGLKDKRRLIKKITYSETDRKSNFLLLSENPNYPPVELPKTLVHRVFLVTQKHQKLTL